MRRRGVLASMIGLVTGLFGGGALARSSPKQDAVREFEATRAKARAVFPYTHVTVHGTEALATWERLRREGKGWPVIVGDDEALALIQDGYWATLERTPAAILAAAAKVKLPRDLEKQFAEEYGADAVKPEDGAWPAPGKGEQPGLTVASDILTGKPYDRVHIVQLPTSDGSEVPAYLHWGSWNACPEPEMHVALLRKWKRLYGAELVGLAGDTMNLRVSRRPATRDEAMAVAREQYLYCSDIVDQGVGALRPLAASLMDSDWWYFWWD